MPRFLAVPILDFRFWILDWELASSTLGLVFLRFPQGHLDKLLIIGCTHINIGFKPRVLTQHQGTNTIF